MDKDGLPKTLLMRSHSTAAFALIAATACAPTTTTTAAPIPPSPSTEATAREMPPPAAVVDPSGRDDPPPAFFSELAQKAQALSAEKPRAQPKMALPGNLGDLRYDAYRSIRFRPESSLWRDLGAPFEAQFFHPGFYYQDALSIFEITSSGAQEVPFRTDWFSYDLVPAPPRDAALTFTGFRLHTALNQQDYKDELVVFQGASYFRPLGAGSVYGLSARGLAVDLGERVEEFPRFSEFYLVRPGSRDQAIWVLALLESESVTGAYAFRIEPGAPTVVSVTAELFPRSDRKRLGLAPLSSMYLFGEEGPSRFGDFRPEVHDSDGLSLWLGEGEWLYRPLRNPERTTVCSFRADGVRGFGLVQRDREFSSYQDLEARYEARPSIWIEPLAGFDAGVVRLLEIATRLETDDNIAVAFVPDAQGQKSLRYRLHVGLSTEHEPPAATARATRIARTERGTRFVVDFGGSESKPATLAVPTDLVLTAAGATVLEQHLEPHARISGHRASFELEPSAKQKDVELRAFLRRGPDAVSETWSYLWQPTP